MVLGKDAFFEKVNSIIGEKTDDEALSFLEDMQDTYNDMQKRIEDANGQDWKKKFEDNDRMWRAKYKHRWNSGVAGNPDEPEEDEELKALKKAESITIDDLFKDDGKGREVK